MANLSDALRGALSPEDLQSLQTLADELEYEKLVEDVVADGALAVDKRTSRLDVTGTQAWSLADGTREGQVKVITCVAAASTPSGVVTPDSFADGTDITFDAVGESVVLQWISQDGWKVIANESATVA